MSDRQIDQALQEGVAHHQMGRLQQAEQIYRNILAVNPNCAPAFHLLGLIAHQVGRSDAGAKLIEQAIQLGLRSAEVFNNLGECNRTLGKFEEAQRAYLTAIQLNPNYAEAMSNLGLLLSSAGQSQASIPYFERAISLRPNLANAHFSYGVALDSLSRGDEAIREWQQTLRYQPDHAEAIKRLSVALRRLGRLEEAAQLVGNLVAKNPDSVEYLSNYALILAEAGKFAHAISAAQQLVELKPDYADAHNTLGLVYVQAGRYEEALTPTQRAFELNPQNLSAAGNLGIIYQKLERHAEAIEWCERAVKLDPGNLIACQSLFYSYNFTRQLEKAVTLVERALEIHPDSAEMHLNYSIALLGLGRYEEGFREYEWRTKCKIHSISPRNFVQSQWMGTNTGGRPILVHSEQGYGDTIQFARYIPMIVSGGTPVILEEDPVLCAVLKSLGDVRVIPIGSELPHFHYHIALPSLPHVFKTTLESIPTNIPYLHADRSKVDVWKPIIESHASGLKVGIVWGGNTIPDPRRSCSIKSLAMLADVPNVTWYSLQTGDSRVELNDAPVSMKILDLGKNLHDFSDTAAAMSQLDLILTIDTASAHLAGAMGLNAWVLLPFACDWRWTMSGESTPWYPTLRLFRQTRLNEWNDVIESVRKELRLLVSRQ